MTKKELLENPYFKAMPDNTQIVFGTSNEPSKCRPVMDRDLTFVHEVEGFAKREITGGEDPIYGDYLVINPNQY